MRLETGETMPLFRTRPFLVKAEQYRDDSLDPPAGVCVSMQPGHPAEPHLHTPGGARVISPGDWVITGTAGEQYPCKPDLFARTYEPVPVPRETTYFDEHEGG